MRPANTRTGKPRASRSSGLRAWRGYTNTSLLKIESESCVSRSTEARSPIQERTTSWRLSSGRDSGLSSEMATRLASLWVRRSQRHEYVLCPWLLLPRRSEPGPALVLKWTLLLARRRAAANLGLTDFAQAASERRFSSAPRRPADVRPPDQETRVPSARHAVPRGAAHARAARVARSR